MTPASGPSTILDADDRLPAHDHRVSSSVQDWLRDASRVVLGGIRHVEANMVPVGVCAGIMFPAYWFVWKFLFPQPYENLWIRLVGSLLCLVIAAKDRWPPRFRRFLPLVWLGTVLYSGPFFFTFMLLQNNNSTVWLMSTMAGLFLVVLLLDWISLFVLFILGSLLAWRIHLLLSPDVGAVGVYLEFIPIFLFALTAGTIFNYQAAGLRQAKERARQELGMLLAKELRSPLIAMRTNAASLGKFLPLLIGVYPDAAAQEASSEEIVRQLGALQRVPARIEEAIDQMGGIIDVLMTEGGEPGVSRWRASSMQRCLDEAIAQLPVAAEFDRARIVVDPHYDFLFRGSPILMRHILARVLEASLNEVWADNRAELLVTLGTDGDRNYLRLADSSAELRGAGARRYFAAHTEREFAGRSDLAFAEVVLNRFGGSVTRAGETILWFPRPDA